MHFINILYKKKNPSLLSTSNFHFILLWLRKSSQIIFTEHFGELRVIQNNRIHVILYAKNPKARLTKGLCD